MACKQWKMTNRNGPSGLRSGALRGGGKGKKGGGLGRRGREGGSANQSLVQNVKLFLAVNDCSKPEVHN